MSISLTCFCGRQVAVGEELAGKQAVCPACGQRLQIPAMGIRVETKPAGPMAPPHRQANPAPQVRRLHLWPWLTAGVGLVLIVAGVLAIRSMGQTLGAEPDDAQQAASVPATAPDEEQPPHSGVTTLPKELPTELPSTIEPVKPLPPITSDRPPPPEPSRRPTLEVVRAEPAMPHKGGSLKIYLQGNAKGKVVFQYRTSSRDDWQPAPDGVVALGEFTGPLLIVEFRALDDRGVSSEILRRTWKIQPPPPLNLVEGPIRLEWQLKQGDTFYQELRVIQKPSFNIAGLPFTTSLQYTVLSSFTVATAGTEGLVVRQKVESARLLEADTVTRSLLAPAVLKLPGTTFEIHLNSKMEVTKFTGATDKVKMAVPNVLGGQGLQLASLLDRDGWKEMAQATFFQPNRGLKPDAKWARPMTHNWGPLGSWSGQVLYAYAGQQKSIHQIAYVLKLAYKPPAPGAGGLPFQIGAAAFQPQQAGGLIHFDAAKGKVVEAQERFHVRGRLNIILLGQNTAIDIDEDQLFYIRILEGNPLKKK